MATLQEIQDALESVQQQSRQLAEQVEMIGNQVSPLQEQIETALSGKPASQGILEALDSAASEVRSAAEAFSEAADAAGKTAADIDNIGG